MPIIYAAKNLHLETLKFLCQREYDVESVLDDTKVNQYLGFRPEKADFVMYNVKYWQKKAENPTTTKSTTRLEFSAQTTSPMDRFFGFEINLWISDFFLTA